jgi:hypothetical protein
MYFKKNEDENIDRYFFSNGSDFILKNDVFNLFENCITYSYEGIEGIGICQSVQFEMDTDPKISIYSLQMKELFRNENISRFEWIRGKSKQSILNFLKSD